MMIPFILLTFLSLSFPVFAQEKEKPASTLIHLNAASFVVQGVEHITREGIPYTRVNYRYHAEELASLRPEPILLAAQAIAIPASLYGTFRWQTKSGTSGPSWLLADDKMKHMFAGFFIGDVTNLTLQLLIPEGVPHRRLIATLSGFGAAALVGTVKELRDARGYGTPDPKDALATAIGGGLGTISMSFDVNRVFRARSHRERHNPRVHL